MADLGKVMVTPKGTYSASATYEILDLVAHNGSSYIALKAVKGVTPANDGVNWQIHGQGYPGNAAGIPIKDTQGMVVTAGANSNTQTLIDAIADRVMTKLIATNMIANNLLATDPKMVLGAPMGKQLKDEIDKQSSDLPDKLKSKQVLYGTSEIVTDDNGAGWIPFTPNFKNNNIFFCLGVMDVNIADRCIQTPAYNGMAVTLYKSSARVANRSVWLTWIAIGTPL